MECGSYNTSREGVPVVPRPATDGPAADNEDGWKQKKKRKLLEERKNPLQMGVKHDNNKKTTL